MRCTTAYAGMALYDPARHHAHVAQYWMDPGVGCLCYGAWALACLGRPNHAVQRVAQALALAREAGHDFSLAYAVFFAAVVHHLRREAEPAHGHAQALLDLSRDKGFPALQAWATLLLGCALAHDGRASEGSALVRQAHHATHAAGARVSRSASLAELASVCLRAGQTGQGLAAVDEGLAFVVHSDERFYEAELLRVRGELRLQAGAPEAAALDDFRQALAVARQQQGRLWELRAATSLARLHQRQGQPALAISALRELLQVRTEGLQTPTSSRRARCSTARSVRRRERSRSGKGLAPAASAAACAPVASRLPCADSRLSKRHCSRRSKSARRLLPGETSPPSARSAPPASSSGSR